MDLNDQRTARVVVDVAERIATRTIDRLTPRTSIGVVFGAPDTTRRSVSVRLKGQSEPSAGFIYGSIVPADGDLVRVKVEPKGDRYVDDVLGRDVGGGSIPVVAELPDPEEKLRAQQRFVPGAAGVADQVYVCRKNASDVYEWAPVL